MAYTPHNPMPNTRRKPECASCEAMVTEALDGTLSPAEQRLFELHLAACTACSTEFAEAQRGAAWLEMLKSPRPQPRPELLASILAQTSGAAFEAEFAPAMAVPAAAPMPARLIPFIPRPGAWQRLFGVMLEPRLAMTAAMAFFSIALTLSLAGVRLNEIHASDLSLSGARRAVYTAEAGTVRFYDNLRVVHVLESRADDLRENLREEPTQAPTQPAEPTAPAPRPGESEQKTPPPANGGSSQLHAAPAGRPVSSPLLASVLAVVLPSSFGDLS